MKFEGYRQEKRLGTGASAHVYLATHLESGRNVAIKVFHPSIWAEKESQKRAQTELLAVQKLQHPGIIQVRDSFLDHQTPALVFDYVDGISLEEFQKQLPYVLPEVSVFVILQVLGALEHAHSQGVLHRDLKPANILISKEGRVFITDFGLARITNHSRMTLSGTVLGSPDFMSPEQAQGDTLTFQSDVFSVAALLYFLVTGTRPFTKSTPLSTLTAVISKDPEQVQMRNPKVSPALALLIHRGLEKSPEKRFQSVREFAEALEEYLLSVGLGKPSEFQEKFSAWMESPSNAVLEYLRDISECLVRRGQSEIKSKNWDEAFQTYSHLSQVAPESSEISRGLDEISNARTRLKNRKKISIFLGVFSIFLLLFASIFYFVSPDRLEPVSLTRSEVNFHVHEGVEVYWDEELVDPNQSLKDVLVGAHRVKFVRPGFSPIEKTVLVKAGEPTDIFVKD